MLPILGATLSGRFDVPVTGDEAVLAWIQQPVAHRLQRVFFLGSGVAIPGTSFGVSANVSGLVDAPGLPQFSSLLPGGSVGAVRGVVDAVNDAESGSTIRLGATLASYDIRYIVVPTSAAPSLGNGVATPSAPPPEILLAALSAQSDLHELPSEAGVLIFENTAWTGRVAPAHGRTPPWLRSLLIGVELAMFVLLARGAFRERRRRRAVLRNARFAARLERGAPSLAREFVGLGRTPLSTVVVKSELSTLRRALVIVAIACVLGAALAAKRDDQAASHRQCARRAVDRRVRPSRLGARTRLPGTARGRCHSG